MKTLKKILCVCALGSLVAGCQSNQEPYTSSVANNNPGTKGQDSYTNNPNLNQNQPNGPTNSMNQ